MTKTYEIDASNNIITAIRTRQTFTADHLTGHQLNEPWGARNWGHGQLQGNDLLLWKRCQDRITYMVLSGETPIAWFVDHQGRTPRQDCPYDGWAVVTDRFSPVTSEHQSLVRDAIGIPNWAPNADGERV